MQQLADCTKRCTQATSWELYICLVRCSPFLVPSARPLQKGKLSYAHIKGSIGYAKAQLNQLLEDAKKTEFIKNLTADLRNSPLSATNIELTQSDERQLANLKVKYVTSLIQNIDKRFSKCQDIFSAFKVFSPGLLPRYVLLSIKREGYLRYNS